jgi:FkbM family methyltransferase
MIKSIVQRTFNFFKSAITKFWAGIAVRLGYRNQGTSYSFFPRNTMEESLRHILKLNFQPDIVVDVGAACGTIALLNTFPRSRYLWIEPLSEFENDLKNLALRFKGDYLIAAAGRYNGKVSINMFPDLMASSILDEYEDETTDGIKREVQLIKLDDLADRFDLKKNLLLKIDVQGAELEVLEGAQRLINNCEIIILECSFFKFKKNIPEFFDIVYYMKTKGFITYEIFDGCNRPLDNALAQKDVLFVKENGYFRKTHKWA